MCVSSIITQVQRALIISSRVPGYNRGYICKRNELPRTSSLCALGYLRSFRIRYRYLNNACVCTYGAQQVWFNRELMAVILLIIVLQPVEFTVINNYRTRAITLIKPLRIGNFSQKFIINREFANIPIVRWMVNRRLDYGCRYSFARIAITLSLNKKKWWNEMKFLLSLRLILHKSLLHRNDISNWHLICKIPTRLNDLLPLSQN